MIAIPPPPPSAKEQAETSFQVRQAVIGQGFGVGASGLLRISERGLSFSRPGRSEPDWTIGWRDLAYAGRDQGVWDAPYPLLLRRRDGSRRYLARIDAGGHYLSGDPILAAIAKERKAPAKEAAPAKTPEAHPNGQGGRP